MEYHVILKYIRSNFTINLILFVWLEKAKSITLYLNINILLNYVSLR